MVRQTDEKRWIRATGIGTILAAVLAGLLGVEPADAAVTTQVLYKFGDDGAVGVNNLPLDSSGNGRDMLNHVAGPLTVVGSGGPRYNDAYYTFLNQGSYFHNYDPPEDNVGVEVWVRTSNLAQNNAHVIGTGSNLDGLGIGFEATGGRGWFGAVSSVAFISDPGVVDYTSGEWVHLAVVRDSGLSTFYVNGVAASAPVASAPFDANGTIHIAVNAFATVQFDGDISYARIFTFLPGQFSASDLAFVPAPAALPAGLALLAASTMRRKRQR